jgi:hypothetical protein
VGSIPNEIIEIFNLPDPSSRTMALGFSQLLTEMSLRNLLGGKALPARKAGNLTSSCDCLENVGSSSHVSRPYKPPRPVTGIALLTFTCDISQRSFPLFVWQCTTRGVGVFDTVVHCDDCYKNMIYEYLQCHRPNIQH